MITEIHECTLDARVELHATRIFVSTYTHELIKESKNSLSDEFQRSCFIGVSKQMHQKLITQVI